MKRAKKQWERKLYLKQDYPDNYTPPSFLKDMQKIKNVKTFTLTEAINGATILNNQISCITLFLLIFYSMYNELISPTQVFCGSGIVTILGYIVFICNYGHQKHDTLDDCKTLLTVLFFGYIFSPPMYQLTDAISTDTIFSMTFFVFLLNLVFYDYGLSVAIVSKVISINAAIFGSICLASRLSSSYHAFVLLVVSVIFFVLYPILAEKFWKPIYLLPITLICSWLLYKYSISMLITYLTLSIFINFYCPWLFIRLQKHKENIHGPWEEATVTKSIQEQFNPKED